MAMDTERTKALSIDEFTELLAEDLGEDPEEIEKHARRFDIEPPWEADYEVVGD